MRPVINAILDWVYLAPVSSEHEKRLQQGSKRTFFLDVLGTRLSFSAYCKFEHQMGSVLISKMDAMRMKDQLSGPILFESNYLELVAY